MANVQKVWKKIRAPFAKVVLAILGALRLTSPNRVVVALSPLFFSASGAIMTLAAHYCPFLGEHLSRGELVGIFIAGAMLGSSKILMWLHGWQKSEARQQPAALPSTTVYTLTPDPPPVPSKTVLLGEAEVPLPTPSERAPAPVRDVGTVQ